jgi:phosphatidate cytidylyltransferase
MPVNSSLSSRLKISGPVVAIVVGSIFWAPALIKFLIGVILLRSLWEFYNIYKTTLSAHFKVALPFALLYIWNASSQTQPDQPGLCYLGLLALFSTHLFFPSSKGGMVRLAITICGFVYIVGLGSYAYYLLNQNTLGDGWGAQLFFAAIFTCKFSDATAYFIGCKYGKHKMIPSVSPNKSWEGLYGAYAGGLISLPFFWMMDGISFFSALVLVLGIVSIATVGDLFESQFKRELNIKDTATDIPGFGGTMDMIDSVLWVLPATYFLVYQLGILV